AVGKASGLVTGDLHTCAIVGGGSVLCWGDNRAHQLGALEDMRSDTPFLVADLVGVEELAAGAEHTCARRGVSVLCWGGNGHDQLGDGVPVSKLAPVPLVW